MQCRCFATPAGVARSKQNTTPQKTFMPIDKGFDMIFATPKAFGAV
jgi:hypothetical protein